jgi:hypothetical protein
MNYLTNYYKNLSEQLQERVNHLQKLLENSSMNPKAEREAMETAVASMPDFHNKIVSHLSTTFGGQFPHIKGEKQKSIQDIAAKLHKAAGEGGFKTFDNAMTAMGKIVHDSDSFRDHLETQAIEDPTKYGVHPDDIMDVDMSDEVEDFIGDLAHNTLHTLHGKK